MTTAIEARVLVLAARGALFVCNHSGGKDSQVMLLKIRAMVPAAQILVVHAELPGVEWEGTLEHVEATARAAGVPVLVCRAGKTLLGMIEARRMFPSPKYRQCTSDLKRGPIEKAIRGYLKAHPEFGGLVVSCMGLRAQESDARTKTCQNPLKRSAKNSVAGRDWYDYLPIAEMTKDEVFQAIADAGQEPHWAYGLGMSRLSCCFCIMANKADLTRAAELNPILYKRYVELEKRIGATMALEGKAGAWVPRPLETVTGIPARRLPVLIERGLKAQS